MMAAAEAAVFIVVILYRGRHVRGQLDDRLRRGLELQARETVRDRPAT